VWSFSITQSLFTPHNIYKLLHYQSNDWRICITFQRASLSDPQWKIKPFPSQLDRISTEWKATRTVWPDGGKAAVQFSEVTNNELKKPSLYLPEDGLPVLIVNLHIVGGQQVTGTHKHTQIWTTNVWSSVDSGYQKAQVYA